MVTCFLANQSCSRCKPEHGRWFSQGGKVSQVEKAVHLGEVAWLASASEILIRILVLGEFCLFQVNFEQKSGKWSKYCKLFKLRCCFCDLGAKYLLCLEPLPLPLSPIDYQDSGGLGGAIHGVCLELFSNFTFSLDELELNPAYFSV